MEVKVVCLLVVLACAIFTSCAKSLPDPEERIASLDIAADMVRALETVIDALKEGYDVTVDSDTSGSNENSGEEIVSRRRRMIGGFRRKVDDSYRGGRRPVYRRPLYRRPSQRVRNGFSPY